jgi:hypothetical protein
VTLVLTILGLYALLGVIFALAFVFVGVGRIDPVARHAPLQFRLVIIPGAAALWPWLLRRWLTAPRANEAPAAPTHPEFSHRGQRLLHSRVWSFWGVALLGAFLVIVALKPTPHTSALSTPSAPVSTPAPTPGGAP